MRHIWLLAVCLGVGGCVAPPGVIYLSFALEGVSLVTTGKSVSDHALSAAVGKDCAMWRLLQEQDIKAVCRAYADESETAITVAANRPAPQPTTQADTLSQPTVTAAAPPSAGTQVLAAPPAQSRDSIDVKSLFVSLFESSGPRAVAPSAAAGQLGGAAAPLTAPSGAAAEVSPPPDSPVYAAASENLFLSTDPAKVPTGTAAAEPETDPPSESVAATAETVASAKPVTGGGRFGGQLAAYQMRHGAEVKWN